MPTYFLYWLCTIMVRDGKRAEDRKIANKKPDTENKTAKLEEGASMNSD